MDICRIYNENNQYIEFQFLEINHEKKRKYRKDIANSLSCQVT